MEASSASSFAPDSPVMRPATTTPGSPVSLHASPSGKGPTKQSYWEDVIGLLDEGSFQALRRDLGKGVALETFVEIMVRECGRVDTSILRDQERRAAFEEAAEGLFGEIDINSNGDVSWDEFSHNMLHSVQSESATNTNIEMELKLTFQGSLPVTTTKTRSSQLSWIPGWDRYLMIETVQGSMDYGRVSVFRQLSQLAYANNGSTGSTITLHGRLESEFPIDSFAYITPLKQLALTTANGRIKYMVSTEDPVVEEAGQLQKLLVRREQHLDGRHPVIRWDEEIQTLYAGSSIGDVLFIDPLHTMSVMAHVRHRYHPSEGNHAIIDILPMPERGNKKLLTSTSDGKILAYDVHKETMLGEIGSNVCAQSMSYNDQLGFMATASWNDLDPKIWAPHNISSSVQFISRLTDSLSAKRSKLVDVHCMEGTTYVVSADAAGLIKVWDLRKMGLVSSFYADGDITKNDSSDRVWCRNVAIDPASMEVFASCRTENGNCAYTFRAEQSASRNPVTSHDNDILTLRYMNELNVFVTVSADCVKFWDAETGEVRQHMSSFWTGTKRTITAFDIDTTGRRFYLGTSQGTVSMHSTVNSGQIGELPVHKARIIAVRLMAKRMHLMAVSADGVLQAAATDGDQPVVLFRTRVDRTAPATCAVGISERFSVVVSGDVTAQLQHLDSSNGSSVAKTAAHQDHDVYESLAQPGNDADVVLYMNPKVYELTCSVICEPRMFAVTGDTRGFLSVVALRPHPQAGTLFARWKSFYPRSTSTLFAVAHSAAWDEDTLTLYVGDDQGNVTLWDMTDVVTKYCLGKSKYPAPASALMHLPHASIDPLTVIPKLKGFFVVHSKNVPVRQLFWIGSERVLAAVTEKCVSLWTPAGLALGTLMQGRGTSLDAKCDRYRFTEEYADDGSSQLESRSVSMKFQPRRIEGGVVGDKEDDAPKLSEEDQTLLDDTRQALVLQKNRFVSVREKGVELLDEETKREYTETNRLPQQQRRRVTLTELKLENMTTSETPPTTPTKTRAVNNRHQTSLPKEPVSKLNDPLRGVLVLPDADRDTKRTGHAVVKPTPIHVVTSSIQRRAGGDESETSEDEDFSASGSRSLGSTWAGLGPEDLIPMEHDLGDQPPSLPPSTSITPTAESLAPPPPTAERRTTAPPNELNESLPMHNSGNPLTPSASPQLPLGIAGSILNTSPQVAQASPTALKSRKQSTFNLFSSEPSGMQEAVNSSSPGFGPVRSVTFKPAPGGIEGRAPRSAEVSAVGSTAASPERSASFSRNSRAASFLGNSLASNSMLGGSVYLSGPKVSAKPQRLVRLIADAIGDLPLPLHSIIPIVKDEDENDASGETDESVARRVSKSVTEEGGSRSLEDRRVSAASTSASTATGGAASGSSEASEERRRSSAGIFDNAKMPPLPRHFNRFGPKSDQDAEDHVVVFASERPFMNPPNVARAFLPADYSYNANWQLAVSTAAAKHDPSLPEWIRKEVMNFNKHDVDAPASTVQRYRRRSVKLLSEFIHIRAASLAAAPSFAVSSSTMLGGHGTTIEPLDPEEGGNLQDFVAFETPKGSVNGGAYAPPYDGPRLVADDGLTIEERRKRRKSHRRSSTLSFHDKGSLFHRGSGQVYTDGDGMLGDDSGSGGPAPNRAPRLSILDLGAKVTAEREKDESTPSLMSPQGQGLTPRTSPSPTKSALKKLSVVPPLVSIGESVATAALQSGGGGGAMSMSGDDFGSPTNQRMLSDRSVQFNEGFQAAFDGNDKEATPRMRQGSARPTRSKRLSSAGRAQRAGSLTPTSALRRSSGQATPSSQTSGVVTPMMDAETPGILVAPFKPSKKRPTILTKGNFVATAYDRIVSPRTMNRVRTRVQDELRRRELATASKNARVVDLRQPAAKTIEERSVAAKVERESKRLGGVRPPGGDLSEDDSSVLKLSVQAPDATHLPVTSDAVGGAHGLVSTPCVVLVTEFPSAAGQTDSDLPLMDRLKLLTAPPVPRSIPREASTSPERARDARTLKALKQSPWGSLIAAAAKRSGEGRPRSGEEELSDEAINVVLAEMVANGEIEIVGEGDDAIVIPTGTGAPVPIDSDGEADGHGAVVPVDDTVTQSPRVDEQASLPSSMPRLPPRPTSTPLLKRRFGGQRLRDAKGFASTQESSSPGRARPHSAAPGLSTSGSDDALGTSEQVVDTVDHPDEQARLQRDPEHVPATHFKKPRPKSTLGFATSLTLDRMPKGEMWTGAVKSRARVRARSAQVKRAQQQLNKAVIGAPLKLNEGAVAGVRAAVPLSRSTTPAGDAKRVLSAPPAVSPDVPTTPRESQLRVSGEENRTPTPNRGNRSGATESPVKLSGSPQLQPSSKPKPKSAASISISQQRARSALHVRREHVSGQSSFQRFSSAASQRSKVKPGTATKKRPSTAAAPGSAPIDVPGMPISMSQGADLGSAMVRGKGSSMGLGPEDFASRAEFLSFMMNYPALKRAANDGQFSVH